MTRTETRRMIDLEAARDAVCDACERIGSRAALDAWHAIHGRELDTLHAMERADMAVTIESVRAVLSA